MGEHRRDRARNDLARDHHTTAPIIYVTLPYVEAQLDPLEESLPKRFPPCFCSLAADPSDRRSRNLSCQSALIEHRLNNRYTVTR